LPIACSFFVVVVVETVEGCKIIANTAAREQPERSLLEPTLVAEDRRTFGTAAGRQDLTPYYVYC
jgi:hypothetical protein